MKTKLIIILLFVSYSLCGKAQSASAIKYVATGAEFKYLQLTNGSQVRIVYFPKTHKYFLCGDKVSPQNKIQPGEVILDKVCDCTEKGIIIIGFAMIKTITQEEAQSLIRNSDLNLSSKTYNTINLNGDAEKIVVEQNDAVLTFFDNHIRNFNEAGINIQQTPLTADSVAVIAYSAIQFEFDSSVLKTSSYSVLDATSADLRSNGKTIILAGYTSSEGIAAHNMMLSKDRAMSVKTYLVNSGVPAKQLKIKAYGVTHPIADNSTEKGRIVNRRVEFH